SHYFVVNTWRGFPVIYLVKRNSEEAVDLAKIEMPDGLKNRFMDSIGHNKGVYAVEGEVRDWLQNQLVREQ
ncbi:MAG: DVU0772 family protein, partial [Desulfatirhabdiaceae bacterium]